MMPASNPFTFLVRAAGRPLLAAAVIALAWALACWLGPSLVKVGDGSQATLVALIGMLLTAAASAWTLSNARRRRMVERLVDERTAELSNEVAERKAAEITLRKGEAELSGERKRLAGLLASLPGVVWEAWSSPDSAKQRINFVSDYVETMLGYTAAEWLATPDFWLTVVYPEDRARVAQDAALLFHGGKGGTAQFRWVRKDGHLVWADSHVMVVCDEAGTPIGLRGVTLDVTGRKETESDLKNAQKELVAISRAAGMADVATSVLHNVGNVLNSVNVSIGVAADKAGQLKVAALSRIAELLREHAGNLPAFFASHPQGQQLTGFLPQLAGHFAADQKAVLHELESLRANIEHINEIVAMQQSYATVGGVIEVLPLPELIEDALRMNAASFDSHGTRIVREFGSALPPVAVDRNKVLLILVNLIRNARHACDDTGSGDKCITVRTHLNGDGLAKISVDDNGVGIPPENLARIFEHGFTTRKGGHGFGLHSSALAASEMGGSLSAHSAGPGAGASFTLELPVSPDYA